VSRLPPSRCETSAICFFSPLDEYTLVFVYFLILVREFVYCGIRMRLSAFVVPVRCPGVEPKIFFFLSVVNHRSVNVTREFANPPASRLNMFFLIPEEIFFHHISGSTSLTRLSSRIAKSFSSSSPGTVFDPLKVLFDFFLTPRNVYVPLSYEVTHNSAPTTCVHSLVVLLR